MMRALRRRAIEAAVALSHAVGLRAVPILMYHALADDDSDLCVAPAAFRAQLAWLRDHGFRSVSLDDYAQALASGGGPEQLGRAVVITFDDGYVNNLEHALPALSEIGFSATFFIATGHVGRTTGWLERPWPVMTWEQIAACARAGIAIGAHTVSHPHLDQIPLEQARAEMADSKREIEQRLGRRVDWLCYPYGGFTPAVEAAAREIGFRGAVSVDPGNTNRPEELFRLRRFYVGPRTGLAHFALATSRLWTWKQRALYRR